MSYHMFQHDENERRQWMNPEAILEEIGLKKGSIFVDIGAGEGFFAIPAAKIVRKEGRIYCIDIHGPSINKILERARNEGLGNLVAKVGKAEETVVCEGCADIVFFGMSLHDLENPLKALANGMSMLKPQGRLVDLDWKKKPMEKGPPLRIRYNEEKARGLIESAGMVIESIRDSGQYHYLVVARRV